MKLTSRSKFLMLLGVFALPVIAAYLAYFGWRPAGHANYGDLLKVTPLQHTAGRTLDGTPFNLDALQGKWLMVHVGAAACDADCVQQLYLMRQVRIAQGKDQSRIERLWVLTDPASPDPALLREHPDHAEAVSRKAGQLGLRAGIQRDRGFAAEALAGYDEGIRMLEALRAAAPDQAMAAYRLALLWWQKGRMLGMAGKRDEEIVLLGKARESLERLGSGHPASGPSSEQLQRSEAYLLGDYGHALQLGNRKDEAVRVFAEAVARWQRLCEARPRSEEYSEGLSWCRQRVADLK